MRTLFCIMLLVVLLLPGLAWADSPTPGPTPAPPLPIPLRRPELPVEVENRSPSLSPSECAGSASDQTPYRYFLFAIGAQSPVGQFNYPSGVAVAPDGMVYVTPTGTLTHTPTPTRTPTHDRALNANTAWDSGWVDIATDAAQTFTHNLGGDPAR